MNRTATYLTISHPYITFDEFLGPHECCFLTLLTYLAHGK